MPSVLLQDGYSVWFNQFTADELGREELYITHVDEDDHIYDDDMLPRNWIWMSPCLSTRSPQN